MLPLLAVLAVLGLLLWALYAYWLTTIEYSVPIWMRYKAALSSEFKNEAPSQFWGLQAKFGEITFLNKYGWVGWLNIEIESTGFRFQNARGGSNRLRSLPPIWVEWSQVHSITINDSPQSTSSESGVMISIRGWVDELESPRVIAVYPSNVAYTDLRTSVLRFCPKGVTITQVGI